MPGGAESGRYMATGMSAGFIADEAVGDAMGLKASGGTPCMTFAEAGDIAAGAGP
jgi:hypothetical protein